VERELDDELRQFLDAATEAKLKEGLRPEDAERTARLQLGSPAAVKESRARRTRWETVAEQFCARRHLRVARPSGGAARSLPRPVCTLAIGLALVTNRLHRVRCLRAAPFAIRESEQRLRDLLAIPGGRWPYVPVARLPGHHGAQPTLFESAVVEDSRYLSS
jgi:hypothetical protein